MSSYSVQKVLLHYFLKNRISDIYLRTKITISKWRRIEILTIVIEIIQNETKIEESGSLRKVIEQL